MYYVNFEFYDWFIELISLDDNQELHVPQTNNVVYKF